ncbi:MAG: hypothetical protein ACRDM0_18685 [Thermoleophilaceae bacterium]
MRGKGLLCAALAAALLATMAPVAPAAAPRGCDPLDPAHCLLPWPNDHFVKDGRLALRNAMMPRNRAGKPVRAADYNRSDGFSPGQIVVTRVPRLDLRRSGAVPVTNMARAFARNAPIVVIDARTGERQLIWAELDSQAERPSERALLIHPGANWREGRRYIVALRNLKDRSGRELTARRAFRRFRSGQARGRRARHFEGIFRRLEDAGIRRRDLYLAWDFTVASQNSLAGRMLSIRNRAFAALGDRDLGDLRVEGAAPPFTVTSSQDLGEVHRVDGSFTVPCFLNRPGCPPGSRFRLNRRGLPMRSPGNVQQERFICLVPENGTNGRPLIFGHGLLGGAEAVLSLSPLVSAANFVACATDWSGMSAEDIPNALAISEDISRFRTLADRNQQGFLNFLFLGRLMLHPQGLPARPEFAGKIDVRRLFYAGASQGGILGGALTAVAPDFERAALIVPAINFSLLLTRSVQFAPFQDVLYESYRGGVERALLTSMIQILWDRGEANGYAWHMTRNPYPDTPRHAVLLHEAFGDHQVANVATEVEARVIGARLRTPALDPGRSRDRRPFYGIRRIPSLPWSGNALVVYDIGPERGDLGTPPAPVGNVPPTMGVDPHAITGREPAAAAQFSEFLKLGGAFVDTCGGRPCYAAGWTGS